MQKSTSKAGAAIRFIVTSKQVKETAYRRPSLNGSFFEDLKPWQEHRRCLLRMKEIL